MYEKLVHHLATLFRGSMAAGEYFPLALQLLAWVRVSKLGRLRSELAFTPTNAPRDAKHLTSIFDQIWKSGALGSDSNAFASVSPALQHLTPGEVIQALELLSGANLAEPWSADDLTATMSRGYGKSFANLPTELTRLMAMLARVTPSMKVYVPFEQSFQLTAAVQEPGVAVFSETTLAWPFPWLINLLSDTSTTIHVGDGLERPGFLDDGRLTQFDITLSFPPFGVKCDPLLSERDLYGRFPEKTTSFAVLAVRHILARTRGRSVVAVPNGLLFSPGAERSLRDDLLAKRQIEAVIGLPAALLPNTALSFSLLVLNPGQQAERIVFVDAAQDALFVKDGKGRAVLTGWEQIANVVLSNVDGPFARVVPVEDVRANDAQLQASRYCRSATDERIETLLRRYPNKELADIVTFVRPFPVSSTEGEVTAMEIGPADFPDFGYVHSPSRKVMVTESNYSKGRKQLLRPFDIAIAIKGNVGRVALCPPELDEGDSAGWVVGQSCLVLRVVDRSVIDPRVLFSFLKSDIGQAQLRQIVSGASVPLIQLRELEKMKIPLPHRIEQERTIKTFEKIVEIEQLISKSRDEQRKLSEEIWTNTI